jgi:beta-phosphoglucomutase-like phosphatase (HAD superfamily)
MKTLIVDCDGVLLEWCDVFAEWLANNGFTPHGLDRSTYEFGSSLSIPGDPNYKVKNQDLFRTLIKIFNQTYIMGKLPPITDAVQSLQAFHKAGYTIKVVSSYSSEYESMKLREQNLKDVFGDIFQEIESLPLRASKIEFLSKQPRESIYIEDTVSHLKDAYALGYSADNLYLIPASYNNVDVGQPLVFKRMNWKQITTRVIGYNE